MYYFIWILNYFLPHFYADKENKKIYAACGKLCMKTYLVTILADCFVYIGISRQTSAGDELGESTFYPPTLRGLLGSQVGVRTNSRQFYL